MVYSATYDCEKQIMMNLVIIQWIFLNKANNMLTSYVNLSETRNKSIYVIEGDKDIK